MGISDRGRYKKSVFLWYSIFDPSADPAESQLETGDTDEAGSPRQFPVSGVLCQRHGLYALESGNYMDRRYQDQCVYLCLAGGDSCVVGAGAS